MLELWLSGKQWPLGLPRLREPLPGCAAPSRIRESNLSRRSWRSGGAAAAADSARLGARGRQASAAPIGCGARGAAVLIIIFQPRLCGAPLTAPRAGGRRLGLPRLLARGSGRSPPTLGLLGLSGFRPPSRPPSAPPLLLPGRAACALASCRAAPPPCAPGSPQSGWLCCARGSLFRRRWRVAGSIMPESKYRILTNHFPSRHLL
ncbi:uncharacterized protein LOC125138096 [Phacochoerus africanus]|uniref:uncharacterized protein LOC125138096 n=1 Tax=Phacochoerus africanus TaxID=41426 RepID=UPI001FDA8175|nr:uncharacterized protein LOC125138096 [Phacochoerus africanus]